MLAVSSTTKSWIMTTDAPSPAPALSTLAPLVGAAAISMPPPRIVSKPSTTPSSWLVVTSHPSREAYATENLVRQGFEVYYPRIMKRIKHARRVVDAPRPLFPSYLFVSHSPETHRWRTLLSTYGVRSVVRQGETPSIIGDAFIRSLRAREVEGILRQPEQPFSVGQEVKIQGGALDGLVGKILELREKDRIVVLLNILNQQSKVFLSAEGLSPV